jgi:hypothetical protein
LRCGSALPVSLHLPSLNLELEARIHDLSETGVALTTFRAPRVGAEVFIGLGSPALVLAARVIHATCQAGGGWRVGCALQRPLAVDAVLDVVVQRRERQAAREEPPANFVVETGLVTVTARGGAGRPASRLLADRDVGAELRAAGRHLSNENPDILMARKPWFSARAVRVRDISLHGLGLCCEVPQTAGTKVAFSWTCGPAHLHRTLLGTLRHASQAAGGLWQMGCEFDEPLTTEEVAMFLLAAGNR